MEKTYQYLADLVLMVHGLFIAFVVLGLGLILAGYFCGWQWTRNWWFRICHLGAIVLVVVQSWAGMICPLTTWEMLLRQQAGQPYYEGSFIQHWLHALIYYQAPPWVFAVVYSAFAMLVVAAWVLSPPQKTRRRDE